MPCPSREEWQRHTVERSLSEREQSWIAKYERSLYERRTAATRSAPRRRAATHSPARPDAWFSSRSRSRGRSDIHSPRRSSSRHCSRSRTRSPGRGSRHRSHSRRRELPHRSRSPREHLRLQSHMANLVPWTHSPELHLEPREIARNAAPMYPARVETQASVYSTCVRLEPRAWADDVAALGGSL